MAWSTMKTFRNIALTYLLFMMNGHQVNAQPSPCGNRPQRSQYPSEKQLSNATRQYNNCKQNAESQRRKDASQDIRLLKLEGWTEKQIQEKYPFYRGRGSGLNIPVNADSKSGESQDQGSDKGCRPTWEQINSAATTNKLSIVGSNCYILLGR